MSEPAGSAQARWAMVTGASGEIGAVVARRLADDGYDLALHSFRHPQAAAVVVQAARGAGRQVRTFTANFAQPRASDRLAAQVLDATGGLDVLVTAAASGVMRPVAELTEKHWSWTLAVNVHPLAALATRLRPRACVALSSTGAARAVPGYAAVGASKAALESLVRSLAVELAPASRVNALQVGLVDSSAAQLLPGADQLLADVRARTPLGRLVSAQDVAATVAWLVSEQAAMLTGSTIVLDGGRALLL